MGCSDPMAGGNFIINKIYAVKSVYVYNNTFMTLACGLLALTFIKVIGENKEMKRVNQIFGGINDGNNLKGTRYRKILW